MKGSSKFWVSNLVFIVVFIVGVLFFIQRNDSEDIIIRADGSRSEIHDGTVDYSNERIINSNSANAKENNSINNATEIIDEEYPIYITGEINNLGIYHIKNNTYVYEVIEMAGGFTSEAAKSYLNLAAKVNFESHIFVPNINDDEVKVLNNLSKSSNNISFSISPPNGKLININIASAEELKSLPGIGQAMAERIIKYRDANGNFNNIEELMNISGIKENKFSMIKDLITT